MFVNTINKIQGKLKMDLAIQRDERKKTENTLLQLLEETCRRLEQLNEDNFG